MKFSHSVEIDVPTAAIDLGQWIFGMSDAVYQQCAKGHRAMAVLGDAERSGMINVASIGGPLLIQRYKKQLLTQALHELRLQQEPGISDSPRADPGVVWLGHAGHWGSSRKV